MLFISNILFFYVKHKTIFVLHKIFIYVCYIANTTMEHIRYRLLIRLLSHTLHLALVFEIIFAVIILIFYVQTIVSDDALLSAWPVEVTVNSFDLPLTSDNPNVGNLSLPIYQGTIQFSLKSIGYYLVKGIDAVFLLGLIMVITVLLKRIFRSLANQHPFTGENARRIRLIALLVLLAVPYSIAKTMAYQYFIRHSIHVEGKEYAPWFGSFSSEASTNKLWLAVDFNGEALIAGIILLLIAEVFRIGILIKTDNESFV